MDLSCLTSLVRGLPEFKRLKALLLGTRAGGSRLLVSEPARPYVVAALYQELGLPVLVVTAQPEEAKRLFEQLQAWCPSPLPLHFFPEAEFLADESMIDDPIVASERLQTLSALLQRDSLSDNKPPLVVCSALAAASKTLPKAGFAAASHDLKVGMNLDLAQIISRWQDMGYELGNLVEVPGTMSRRGGIVDIFSPNNDLPARIEFSGNQIESIRLFDPQTQRSSTLVASVTIVPAGEINTWLGASTILDYLPENSLLVTDDLGEIRAVIVKLRSELEEFQQAEQGGSRIACSSPLADLEAGLEGFERRLALYSWDAQGTGDPSYASLPLKPAPSYGGRLEKFVAGLRGMLNENRRVVIISQQTKRLAELLQEGDVLVQPVSSIEHTPSQKSVTLVQGSLAEGWAVKDTLTLLTDKEIFGLVKERRLPRKRPVRYHWFISDLSPGDYVVHVEHGIAIFSGLAKMSAEGVEREYLVLEYAIGDKLYVPTDQVDRVSRYVGADDRLPTLSRLGTQEWARAKQRVKEAAVNMAEELLNLYAKREVTTGFGFSADNLWQQELESSFPYMETSDQLEAVQAVKTDMEKPKPMDRLVCGDVGYGKTEVALRAAFKATMDGKQVALLVPTTVLAQQHLLTFRERLQAFPVRLEMLSRFCTEKEQAEIVEGLAVGTVDICIGTHRLLQKDVKFKDLGLVIIDEEQRFGVVHKEHFRKLRQEVDVLTLSATPIPRTLHMSLAGIRDMSTMDTPPEERLPIKTYVGIYDDKLVREAILRELERNGQVFYVHNRVQSIASVASKLGILVPEAKISVAHGQMDEENLAEVMSGFSNHQSDVLVTTTIIESGLDMSNVNTLIVDQADKLGLAQLYQLRGRVGRGSNHAHAYFLFDRGKRLTPEARKRLRTISEATELGAGFGIAMRDLEIRGAGNLLGVEQSGHIATVGFDLYCRLLTEAVEELRQKRGDLAERRVILPVMPVVNLPLTAYIPENYISLPSTRISFYQRLVAVREVEQISQIIREMNDRFGKMPQPLGNLLYIVEIRLLAAAGGIESVVTEDKNIALYFAEAKVLDDGLSIGVCGNGIKVGSRQVRLDIKRLGNRWQEVLKDVLQKLAAESVKFDEGEVVVGG